MIRATFKSNTKVLDSLSNYAARYAERVSAIGESVFKDLEEITLDTLRTYPPPPPNSTYIRTYTLRDGWAANLERIGTGFAIVFENKTPYTKYVVGSFAKNRDAAASLQAFVHQGRWPLATDTIGAFEQLFQEELNAQLNQELSAYGSVTSSRRAFTR